MRIILLGIYWYLFAAVTSRWSFKESRVCEASLSSAFPFTGFKINRQYKISGTIPQSMHFIGITHCDHGKMDYEKVFRTTSSDTIDWDKPFCMLRPKIGKQLPLKDEDTVQRLLKKEKMKSETNDMSEEESKLASTGYQDNLISSLTAKLTETKIGLKNLLRNQFDKNLEKLSEGNFLQYTGKKHNEHLEDVRVSDPQSSLEWESRHLVCFKMARRKKYARRNISFYMPYTFVGGLFECPIPKDKRREIFQSYTAKDFLKSFDFECDNSIARPISPLIAEDSTKQWFETKLAAFTPYFRQTIPYLSTATPLNLRFASSDTPDMYGDTWATKIDVNEDYAFTELDLHLVSQAIAVSADLLNKILKPVDINDLMRTQLETARAHQSEDPSLTENDTFIGKVKNLSLDQQMGMVISSLGTKKKAVNYVNDLQTLWDKIMSKMS